MRTRKTFSSEEDSVLLAVVKKAKEEKVPLSTAFIKIADELGRPVKSVTNRYRRLLKAMEGGQEGFVKGLSESEQLVIKLKALQKEKARDDEKNDMWKTKYMALVHDYNETQDALRKLTTEHSRLVATVKELLGESAHPEESDEGQGALDI